jgi:hypothetical protein
MAIILSVLHLTASYYPLVSSNFSHISYNLFK